MCGASLLFRITLNTPKIMSSEDFEMTPMTYPGHTNYDEQVSEKFNQLAALNLNGKAESKNGLAYVSWANAWKAFKEVYPSATYRIIKNPQTLMPYFVDPQVGIMVFTEVSANGLTYEMWLPVMDSANKAMRTEPYAYTVWDKFKKAYVEKTVEAASSFDINKAIMRCLVKNLAMFGLALYIYAGEDMPEATDSNNESLRQAIRSAGTTQDLLALYQQYPEVADNPQIMALFSAKKEEILKAA